MVSKINATEPTDAPAELRRTSDGALLNQLAGPLEKGRGVTFSPDGSAFVVSYTDAPAELRRTSDGVLLSQLAGPLELLSDGIGSISPFREAKASRSH